jgi:hypothetical protein
VDIFFAPSLPSLPSGRALLSGPADCEPSHDQQGTSSIVSCRRIICGVSRSGILLPNSRLALSNETMETNATNATENFRGKGMRSDTDVSLFSRCTIRVSCRGEFPFARDAAPCERVRDWRPVKEKHSLILDHSHEACDPENVFGQLRNRL